MAFRSARAGNAPGGPALHAGYRRSRPERRARRTDLVLAALLFALGAVATAHAQSPVTPVGESSAAQGTAAGSPIASGPVERPADLHDPEVWVSWRNAAHLEALPEEARIFYRRGLHAIGSGNDAEGVRLLRAAGELDPHFASPHVTLGSWYLTREPGQSLQEWGVFLRLLARDFRLQFDLAANAAYHFAHAVFFGLMLTAALLLALHLPELRHMFVERLRMVVSPASAKAWSWVLLALPFLAGFGAVAPLLALLGLLWPVMKPRERAIPVMLALATLAAPFAGIATGRLASPLQPDAPPFFGVTVLEHAPFTPGRLAELRRAAEAHPNEPFLQFGLAWIANRGGDLATAEAAYRRVLAAWPEDDRTLNNLGNLVASQGRMRDALDLYGRATRSNPGNPAALFNASQVHTRLFDYRAASDAAARAAALDFELVQRYRNRGTDGALLLADQWIAPRTFWLGLVGPRAAAHAVAQLPPAWRGIREAAGWPAAAAAIAFGVLGVAVGLLWHRRLPLRSCSNCGTVVCRRCSERRREVALCPGCSGAAARAESQDFERVLLSRQARRTRALERSIRTALACLLPGYGHLAFRKPAPALLTGMVVAALVGTMLGFAEPFDAEPSFALAGAVSAIGLAIGWTFVYITGILAFVVRQSRSDAAVRTTHVRSRVATPSRVKAEAA